MNCTLVLTALSQETCIVWPLISASIHMTNTPAAVSSQFTRLRVLTRVTVAGKITSFGVRASDKASETTPITVTWMASSSEEAVSRLYQNMPAAKNISTTENAASAIESGTCTVFSR